MVRGCRSPTEGAGSENAKQIVAQRMLIVACPSSPRVGDWHPPQEGAFPLIARPVGKGVKILGSGGRAGGARLFRVKPAVGGTGKASAAHTSCVCGWVGGDPVTLQTPTLQPLLTDKNLEGGGRGAAMGGAGQSTGVVRIAV